MMFSQYGNNTDLEEIGILQSKIEAEISKASSEGKSNCEVLFHPAVSQFVIGYLRGWLLGKGLSVNFYFSDGIGTVVFIISGW